MPVDVYTQKFGEKKLFIIFLKNVYSAFFSILKRSYLRKMRGYPQLSFWMSIAPDMIYLSPMVVIWEKILPISGTALKNTWVPIKYCLWDKYICFELIELIVSNAKGLSAQWGKTLISHCFTVRVSNQLACRVRRSAKPIAYPRIVPH